MTIMSLSVSAIKEKYSYGYSIEKTEKYAGKVCKLLQMAAGKGVAMFFKILPSALILFPNYHSMPFDMSESICHIKIYIETINRKSCEMFVGDFADVCKLLQMFTVRNT